MEKLCSSLGCSSLTWLSANVFIGVPDAFALVRLGWTEVTEIGCDLTDELFVDALDREEVLVLLILDNLDPLWEREVDRVREAKTHVEHTALNDCLITDTDDLDLASMSFVNTRHHVLDEVSCETMTCLRFTILEDAIHAKLAVLDLHTNFWEKLVRESALRPSHMDDSGLHLDGDTGWNSH